MKRVIGLLSLLLVLVSCSDDREKKVVLIIIDGVPADVLESVNTPNIDEITSVGGYARAYQGGLKDGYSETPTVSAPGYMNMITGVWANKHNVRGNSVRNPNYNYWNVFRIAEEVNPELHTAIFSTWLDNRTKLVGESKLEAGSVKLDYSFDGFELDTVAFPHGNDRMFIHRIDEHVSKEAASYIQEKAPDVSWVYLEYTDDMGHGFGDSPQMIDAVEKADVQIGRIWEAIKYREENFSEDWMIAVTTDHGRTASNGKGHGGQSERERTTWITTNLNDLNNRFQSGLSVVDVLPTALNHLGLDIPDEIKAELDGVSYSGKISLQEPKAVLENAEVKLSWKAEGKGTMEIFMARTNNFASGSEDDYELLGKAALKDETYSVPLELAPGTYKFLFKAYKNWTNTWLVVKNQSMTNDN